MLNHITIMGRLTREPELRYTGSNIPVCSFTLAVDRDYSGRDGGEKQTDFIDCVAWRQSAEFVSKYFSKGSMAVVSGRLEIREWTDRDGNKRRNAEINAEHVYFGEAKKPDSGRAEPPKQQNTGYQSRGSYQPAQRPVDVGYGGYAPAARQSSFAELDEDDQDLPF